MQNYFVITISAKPLEELPSSSKGTNNQKKMKRKFLSFLPTCGGQQLGVKSSTTNINEEQNVQRKKSKYSDSYPASYGYSSDLRNWRIFNFLRAEFISQIHMIMAFGDDAALIVTKDRMVYGLGNNCNSRLGIGNVTNTLQPEKVEALCGKNIKTFCCNNCMTCIFALTEEGEVYSWGFNGGGLGQGLDEYEVVHTPTLVATLIKERIVNIACSNDHSLALTETGKVYTWGNRKYSETFCDGLIKDLPWQVKYEEKIVRIACGLSFNVAITDSGKICSWGINNHGQLGVDKWDKQKETNPSIMVSPKDITIVKIVCGSAHTLALTRSGTIYSWGRNNMGQLGRGTKTEKEVMSTLISSFSTVIGIGKVLDIAARHNGSLAVNENGRVYIWGQCFNEEITVPTATAFSNMYDVLSYNVPYIIHKPLNEKSNILKCLGKAFDDQSTSDFTIKVQGKSIHVHKVILNIRCQHFKNMFHCNWLVQGQSNSSMLVHDRFSYNVYKAFLKYLYTGVIDLALEETLELIKLAESYDEKNLKRDCIQMIKKKITPANVVCFYYKAIEYEAKEVKEFCFKFAQDHMMDVERAEISSTSDKNIELDVKMKVSYVQLE